MLNFHVGRKIQPLDSPPGLAPLDFTVHPPEAYGGSPLLKINPSFDYDPKRFENLLGNNKEFIFKVTDKDPLITGIGAKVYTKSGDLLMQVRICALRVDDRGDGEDDTVTFTDNTGNVLFTCAPAGQDRVSVIGGGGNLYGHIRTKKDGCVVAIPCELQVVKKTPISMEDSDLSFKTLFKADGFVIANIVYSFCKKDFYEIKLSFPTSLDINSKAMIMAGAYYLNAPLPPKGPPIGGSCSWFYIGFLMLLVVIVFAVAAFCRMPVKEQTCGRFNEIRGRWECYCKDAD